MPTVTYNTPKFVTIDTIKTVKNVGIKRLTAFIADSIAPILFVGTVPNIIDCSLGLIKPTDIEHKIEDIAIITNEFKVNPSNMDTCKIRHINTIVLFFRFFNKPPLHIFPIIAPTNIKTVSMAIAWPVSKL